MTKLLIYRICLTIVLFVVGIWNYPSKVSSVTLFLGIMGVFFTLDVLRDKSKNKN
ncbi:hypothetical protein ACFCYN_21320 [Gottfriedia sp. NPDC056225]|uniref:hypothetical protein n=1 Tax=Gottfriedia sp. NPDC056225 TaxID=3345751 RepID=UPI0035D85DA3